MLFCITGNGKGKTTSSIGMAIRMVGSGKRVLFIQFMKTGESSEIIALKRFPEIEIYSMGRRGFINNNSAKEDVELAKKAWNLFKNKLNENFALYILDELNIAIYYNLIPLYEITKTLEKASKDHDIVVTGRYAPKEIQNISKMVSEILEVKHHYNQGIQAKKGIEY